MWMQWKHVTGALKLFSIWLCKHVFNRFGFPLPESSSPPHHAALPPFFLCNVISPSPSISLTMSAALVHPSSSLPFSTSALSSAGIISIQGCFAAIWNAFSTLLYGLFLLRAKHANCSNCRIHSHHLNCRRHSPPPPPPPSPSPSLQEFSLVDHPE